MGKINTAMCSFLSNKERFADLFNGALFEGRTIIKADELKAASEQYPVVDNKTLHRFRDIKMYLNSGESLRILAVENQNLVDYTLPYRCMQYDTLEYGRQLDELKQYNKANHCLRNPAEWLSGITKNDRLAPVYTLCLYHGEKPWDGPHSLRDMIHFGNNSDNLSHFFADYPMRLFCVNEHSDFSCFHTELREVFTALAFRKNKKKLYTAMTENATFYRLSSETIRVISILLNTPRLWTERSKFMSVNQNNEEEYDMCQAMQELYEDWRNEGIDLMSLLVQKLFTDNRVEDLKRATQNPELRDKLLKEYSLKA